MELLNHIYICERREYLLLLEHAVGANLNRPVYASANSMSSGEDASPDLQLPARASGTDTTSMSMIAQGDGHDTGVVIRQSVAAVPVRQGWQTGLFDCEHDGCDAFCCSVWFPCAAFASIADIVDQGSEGRCVHFTCYLGAAYLGVWWAYTGWYRRKLREQYGLPETPLPDWLTHLLCHWCALAQEYRELAGRGFDVDQDKVDRAVSSAIYFLLPAGEIARLHRIPCAETWHYYMGEPLTVFEVHDDGQFKMTVVGPDLRKGQRPQYTVPPNVWFGAFLTHDIESFTDDGSVFVKTPGRDSDLHYSFVGVTCAPAYQFEDDEMATRDGMKTLSPNAEAFINYLIPA